MSANNNVNNNTNNKTGVISTKRDTHTTLYVKTSLGWMVVAFKNKVTLTDFSFK